MNTVRTAWRNVWRNRGRSVISASAAFASTLIVCLIMSMESGYVDDMIGNIKNHKTGDVRIMNATYVKNERIMPLQFFVANARGTIDALETLPAVERAVPMTAFPVSIYRKGEQIPCRAIGVDFERDPMVSSRNDVLVEGSWPEPGSSEIIVTSGLAAELSLKVGSKITAIARTATGGTNGKTFAVRGVVAMSDMDFTGRAFFLDWRTAGEFLRMGGDALAIHAFLRKGVDEELALKAVIEEALRARPDQGEKLDIRPWYEVSEIFGFLKLSRVIFAIYGAIFYLLASTVIFNTTMMSVLERKREIGTLCALGMEGRRIMALFLAESGIIAAIGTVPGLAVGGAIVALVHRVGFNVEAIYGSDMNGWGMSRIIYPSLAPWQYAFILALAIVISVLACIIPARLASRLEPARAISDR